MVFLASTYIVISEGLECWFCLREEQDFKKSLRDTCEKMECSEEAFCYTEVLESELMREIIWWKFWLKSNLKI